MYLAAGEAMTDPRIIVGDCLDVLRTLPDNSVDAVVTDPPSGISFMGKAWDGDKGGRRQWVAWLAEVLAECLRVVKPGGHALVWALPRTSHWTGCAIEDAGWEVRDRIAHLFWQGFPKSLAVDKAIDRQKHDRDQVYAVTRWIAERRDAAGLTNTDIDDAFAFHGMAGHWTSQASQPAVPTLEQVPRLLAVLGVEDPPEEIRRLLLDINAPGGEPGPNWWKREVVGQHAGTSPGCNMRRGLGGGADDDIGDRTAPATPEAQQWEGWGTALKPAQEDWWLARKPLEGTVAGNVQKWGTGALHIDACRYAYGDEAWPGPWGKPGWDKTGTVGTQAAQGFRGSSTFRIRERTPEEVQDRFGEWDTRWPANVYACAKPSRSEREKGCEGLPAVAGHEAVGREDGSAGVNNPRAGAGRTASEVRNAHPTVKPLRLMRWLVRLVTPPGGVVLDPFLGSGTTGCAAVLEGFGFVGVEKDPDYARIAEARLAWAVGEHSAPGGTLDLFASPDAPQGVQVDIEDAP